MNESVFFFLLEAFNSQQNYKLGPVHLVERNETLFSLYVLTFHNKTPHCTFT